MKKVLIAALPVAAVVAFGIALAPDDGAVTNTAGRTNVHSTGRNSQLGHKGQVAGPRVGSGGQGGSFGPAMH